MSKQLREERAQAHAEAVRAHAANNLPAYDKAMARVDELKLKIDAAEQRSTPTSGYELSDPGHKRAFAFGKYLRRGKAELTETEKRSIEFRDVAEGNLAAHIGTYSGLGYLVPTGFSGKIEQALKYYAPLYDNNVFGRLETSTGNPTPYPTSDDTSNSAVLVGEAGTVNEEDITANHVVFNAYKLTSGLIKCSNELLQDAAFDIESWLADQFAVRYGRAFEYFLTAGEGSTSGEPTGFLTYINVNANPNGVVVASGSSESTGGSQTGSNSVGYSDLVNLEHSVDPSYRRGARYIFHDQTLSSIKRIIDKFGRPLWVPGISVGEADTINGYPYTIDMAMPQIAASNVTVAFGDFSKMLIRKVSGFAVRRLEELYAVTDQTGFISTLRFDCNGIVPSGRAMNVLMQHS
jgi:HK97 family phage major capsid protein